MLSMSDNIQALISRLALALVTDTAYARFIFIVVDRTSPALMAESWPKPLALTLNTLKS